MLNLIVAPKFQAGSAEKITKSVVKFLKTEKVEYSVYFSQDFENLKTNIQTLITFGENEFVVVGDDVTVFEVLNNVKDVSKIKLGIIPVSKKDDFVSYIGLETRPIEAIKRILKKKTIQVDFMLVNNYRVLNNVIIGASAEVYEAYDQFKIKNSIAKQFAVSKYGNAFTGVELTLDTKGSKNKTENVFELIVANTGNSQGKVVSPLANVDDGMFNVSYTTMEEVENKKKMIEDFNDGDHIYKDNTTQQWLTNLKITNADKQIKVLLDGKVFTLPSLDINLIEKGLKIYK